MAPPLERALEKKLQDAPAEQKAKILTQQNLWPELLTAKDILSLPPDPTRWIWHQCLPVGGCSMLVAKPKVGKSTFAVCLALAVARGMTFLGRETQPGPVAYLSLDASLQETAELFLHFGLREIDPIFFHAGTAPRDAVTWIMHRIKQNGVRLVIIDTLQRLFRFQNINDYSEVTNTIEPLLDSARQQNCHVMLTHHAKKESLDDLDASVGSTALRGMFYQYLHIKKLPESDTRILRTEGRGGRNFPEYALRFDREGFLELAGTREQSEIESLKPAILDYVGENPEQSVKEIRAAIPAKTICVGKAISELVKAGDIERTGKGKRGDPFLHVLARTLHSVPATYGNRIFPNAINDLAESSAKYGREPYFDNDNTDLDGVSDSVPKKKGALYSYPTTAGLKKENKNVLGTESVFDEKIQVQQGLNSVPKKREPNGNRMEPNPGIELSSRPTPLVDRLLNEIEKETKK
ncbi:MAG TPA: AAA family ATPase [Thermoguttaceae bacterium]